MIAMLGALVFSSLLAQMTTPLPATSALPAAAPVPATAPVPAASATPDEDLIRRGPGTTPRMLPPSASPGDATIVDSGSTNFAGFRIVIHPDYSADVTVGGNTERKRVAAPQARWLFAKLRAAMPLSAMPRRGCMKSASFGSSTFVTYDGDSSPDLTCVFDATSRELLRTAGVIVEQLQVPLRRSRRLEIR